MFLQILFYEKNSTRKRRCNLFHWSIGKVLNTLFFRRQEWIIFSNFVGFLDEHKFKIANISQYNFNIVVKFRGFFFSQLWMTSYGKTVKQVRKPFFKFKAKLRRIFVPSKELSNYMETIVLNLQGFCLVVLEWRLSHSQVNITINL